MIFDMIAVGVVILCAGLGFVLFFQWGDNHAVTRTKVYQREPQYSGKHADSDTDQPVQPTDGHPGGTGGGRLRSPEEIQDEIQDIHGTAVRILGGRDYHPTVDYKEEVPTDSWVQEND